MMPVIEVSIYWKYDARYRSSFDSIANNLNKSALENSIPKNVPF